MACWISESTHLFDGSKLRLARPQGGRLIISCDKVGRRKFELLSGSFRNDSK